MRQNQNAHALWILTGVALRIGQRMGLHVDGATLGLPVFEAEMRRRIWWQIMLPLIGPSLATLGVFAFVENWNNFLWPLVVLTEPDKYPLTIALQAMANNAFTSNARSVAAGTILCMLPILVIFPGTQGQARLEGERGGMRIGKGMGMGGSGRTGL